MNDTTDNIIEVIKNILNIFHIQVPSKQIKETLLIHPYYPSLIAIADTLFEWGIKAKGVKGGINDLSDADLPSIVLLKNNQYIVLESIDKDGFNVIIPGKGLTTLTKENFDDIWSGKVLRVKLDTQSVTPLYKKPDKGFKNSIISRFLTWPSLFFITIIGFFYIFSTHPNYQSLLSLGIVKVIGLVVCIVLFIGHSEHSRLLESLCPKGKISNCQRVVESPAGNISGIPMADLGLLYFSGGLLVLFFSALNDTTGFSLFLLGVLSILALPYTFFSISYQAFVVHSWCWLCLSVQSLFWLEAVLLYRIVLNGFRAIPSISLFPVLFGFGLVLFIWLTLRPIFKSYLFLREKELETSKLRSQPEYIQFQLNQSEKILITQHPDEIIVGPPSAPITLTVVLNPLCKHCKQSFDDLKQIIDFARGHTRGIIRFLVGSVNMDMSESEKQQDYLIALNIAALSITGKRKEMLEALSVWFSKENKMHSQFMKHWIKKYSIRDEAAKKKAEELLRVHSQWVNENHIDSTPTLFMNGIKLPMEMGFNDLKYFLIRLMNS